MWKRIFKNPWIDWRFRQRGWVVVEPWAPDFSKSIIELHRELDDDQRSGFHVSTTSDNLRSRYKVDRLLEEEFAPRLLDYLVDYQTHLGALVVKEPHGDSTVYAHQDGTCADEADRPGIVAWIPATPLDTSAGFLRGLWGSHRYISGVRSTPPTTPPFESVREALLEEMMEEIPARPGQAVLFDSRLVHGSHPNQSEMTRLAGYLSLHPAGTQSLHYWWDRESGLVREYAVDRNFFLTHVFGAEPDRVPERSMPAAEPSQLSLDDIRKLRRRARLRL